MLYENLNYDGLKMLQCSGIVAVKRKLPILAHFDSTIQFHVGFKHGF
jgi:hypothetical protein